MRWLCDGDSRTHGHLVLCVPSEMSSSPPVNNASTVAQRHTNSFCATPTAGANTTTANKWRSLYCVRSKLLFVIFHPSISTQPRAPPSSYFRSSLFLSFMSQLCVTFQSLTYDRASARRPGSVYLQYSIASRQSS